MFASDLFVNWFPEVRLTPKPIPYRIGSYWKFVGSIQPWKYAWIWTCLSCEVTIGGTSCSFHPFLIDIDSIFLYVIIIITNITLVTKLTTTSIITYHLACYHPLPIIVAFITFTENYGIIVPCRYRITEGVNLPFRVLPTIKELGRTRLEVNVKVCLLWK